MNVKAVLCHYKVKDLTIRAIESFRKFYPDMQLTIVDGSGFDVSTEWLFEFARDDKRTSIYSHNWNIHHGPSMHLGIVGSEYDNVFIFESDVTIHSPGLIEAMFVATKGQPFHSVGNMMSVDKFGMKTQVDEYPYIHPSIMLVNKVVYQWFDPFIKHGAPCIQAFIDIYNKSQTDLLVPFVCKEYATHDWCGTRKTYGINL